METLKDITAHASAEILALTSKIKKDIETQNMEGNDIVSLNRRLEQTKSEYNSLTAAIVEETNTMHGMEAEKSHLSGLIEFDKKREAREQEELAHLEKLIAADKAKILETEKK